MNKKTHLLLNKYTHFQIYDKLVLQGNSNHIRQMDNLSSPYQNGLMLLVLIPTHFEWCLFLSLSLSLSLIFDF